MASDWTTLDELPAGSLFETVDGTIALKTEYSDEHRDIGGFWMRPKCYLLESGEEMFFSARPSILRVRPVECVLIQGPNPTKSPSLLNRPCTLIVTNGSERYGHVLSTDERGVWFRGTMERDNPNERDRTYFVPWGSIVWLEMEVE